MAEAVEEAFPGAKFWVGPPLDNGYYYDIDLGGHKLTEEDLIRLEKRMGELAAQGDKYIRTAMPKAEAIQYFTDKGDEYKLDLLQNLNDGEESLSISRDTSQTSVAAAHTEHRLYSRPSSS
jgi:threonyl-tRNA synthetase